MQNIVVGSRVPTYVHLKKADQKTPALVNVELLRYKIIAKNGLKLEISMNLPLEEIIYNNIKTNYNSK